MPLILHLSAYALLNTDKRNSKLEKDSYSVSKWGGRCDCAEFLKPQDFRIHKIILVVTCYKGLKVRVVLFLW